MFESSIKASTIVAEIMAEADIAPDIPDESFYTWIDEAEQLLYSEIIKEIWESKLENAVSPVAFDGLKADNSADTPRFEDVYAVYAGKTQLMHVTPVGGNTFPNTYWKENVKIGFKTDGDNTLRIFYFVRPRLKINNTEDTVKLPPEWVCIIRAKLRGEAFKLVNEDNAAAKWLNDYNVLIEQFKQYMGRRQDTVGV